ncbi:helix-turn-helix domain-containing protein [Natronococcus sp. A-GB1]|uniref:MarR family transcriptional regulator n=1 Tax=Natronococcus sp. A-GB1 TaxID=3037648 RepID=UPI00241E4779|nr:helix-turn-helix domain-containing protein [Natronococcus sp. A-GB1]MDG5762125.1 helix-turn-helix domain-containing protein [Natronococcus sp. A-GB1]
MAELPERDLEVLSLVAEYEPARASTIAEAVHWADSNGDINYRLKKLEQQRLIRREEVKDDRYPLNPKETWITQEGHNELADLTRSRPQTLEERVEWVEKQTGRMQKTYGEVKHRIVNSEDDIDSLREDIEKLDGEVDEISLKLDRLLDALEGLEHHK